MKYCCAREALHALTDVQTSGCERWGACASEKHWIYMSLLLSLPFILSLLLLCICSIWSALLMLDLCPSGV